MKKAIIEACTEQGNRREKEAAHIWIRCDKGGVDYEAVGEYQSSEVWEAHIQEMQRTITWMNEGLRARQVETQVIKQL